MTLAREITRAFNGDWRGDQGFIPTPGHSDRDRGSTVRDSDDGDVVFHSFNGGDWRELKDECRRRGLLPERMREEMVQRWRVAGVYEFTDADGTVLYRTRRMEHPARPKRFEAQRPDGKGGWIDKLGDCPRVLYRLPELLASDPAEPVYFVEGERKADKLASWGLVATSIAFGAKGWRKSYADALAERVVIFLPDNDEPGHEFAGRAKPDMEAAGAVVHVIDLPGLPPKGDIIDWAGSADDLRTLAAQALNPPVETFPIADLAAWEGVQPKPKSFIMPGFVPARELTLATGSGGANKSTFGQQLATCCAAGMPMLGVDVQQCATLYITAEDDEDRLHWMQEHMCRALGVSMGDLRGKLHLVSLRGRLGNELATFDQEGKLRPSSSFKILRATIEQAGAQFVVLDNAAHLFAGNENDRQQVTAFVNLLYSLCQDLGVTIMLVAHANKAGDSYSGSTAWLNAVRSQIVLGRPEGAIDPDERILTLGKANYARQGEELRFRWHEFALKLDSDLPETARAEMVDAILVAGANAAFLACLRARAKQGEGRGVGPNSGANYAPAQFEGMPEAKGFNRQSLKQAMDRLFSLGRIETYQFENKGKGRSVTLIREVPERPRTPSRTAPEHTSRTLPNDARTPPHTHPYTTYMEGAAQEAAAPSSEIRNEHALSRPVFAAAPEAELDADGDTIGWND